MTDRLRIRFSKLGKIRFTSHRDVARMWERALRRSGLPVAWSEGFSPRPLLSFGLALPTGCESLAEYLDVRLSPPGVPGGQVAALAGALTELLPDGVAAQVVAPLGKDAASLQQAVTSCTWELEVLGLTDSEVRSRIGQLLDAPSIPIERERKGRRVRDDLRPSVQGLRISDGCLGAGPGGQRHRLLADLATQPRGVRPAELLEGLGDGVSLARACRVHQWSECSGGRVEPLSWALTPTVPAASLAPEGAT